MGLALLQIFIFIFIFSFEDVPSFVIKGVPNTEQI